LRSDFLYFGQPSRIIRPDQTMQIFAYDQQPLPGAGTNAPLLKKITTWTGAQSGYLTIIDGVRTETWIDQYARTALEVQTAIASQIPTSSPSYSYDTGGHLPNPTSFGGSTSQAWDCCRLLSTTDREGTVTSYTYDPLNRQVATTRNGITVSNIL